MKPLFFEHFYDLTGPKHAEKYEDSESDIKSIHFLAKKTLKLDFSFFEQLIIHIERDICRSINV